jgi:hypothetical protein
MVLTKGNVPVYILAGFAFVAAVAARSIGYLRVESWPSAFLDGRAQQKRRRSRRAGAQDVIGGFSGVSALEGLFEQLKPLHRLHDYQSIRMEVIVAALPGPSSSSTTTFVWVRDDAVKASEFTANIVNPPPLVTSFEIVNRDGLVCRITYRYLDGRARIHLEDEQMLALIHGPLALHVERIVALPAPVNTAPRG